MDWGGEDSSGFLAIKMATIEPLPGHCIPSIACPVVSLDICVGSSSPGTQKLGGVEAPLKLERNLDEFFSGSTRCCSGGN